MNYNVSLNLKSLTSGRKISIYDIKTLKCQKN